MAGDGCRAAAAVICLCRASILCLCRAVCALVRAHTACFGDGDRAAPARRPDQGRAAAHSCPPAVGASAPATRGAAAELVDELVEDVGEAYSELTIVRRFVSVSVIRI